MTAPGQPLSVEDVDANAYRAIAMINVWNRLAVGTRQQPPGTD